MKPHTAIAKSPAKTVQSQANHLFASIAAYIRLEQSKLKLGGNHFSLTAILTVVATKATFIALRQLFAQRQYVLLLRQGFYIFGFVNNNVINVRRVLRLVWAEVRAALHKCRG